MDFGSISNSFGWKHKFRHGHGKSSTESMSRHTLSKHKTHRSCQIQIAHNSINQYAISHTSTPQCASARICTHQYTVPVVQISTHQPVHINTHQYALVHISLRLRTSIYITQQYTSAHSCTNHHKSSHISTCQHTFVHISISTQ